MQVAFRRLTWDSLGSRLGSARSSLLWHYLIYLNRCCISGTYYLGAFSLPCCTKSAVSKLGLLILFRRPVTKKRVLM
jgi:hypothetical protein